jgi:hypothetical protein
MLRKIQLWLLNKFPLPEHELLGILAEKTDFVSLSKEDEEEVIEQLSAIELLPRYLDSLITQDVKGYFKATSPSQQLVLRGSASRIMSLKARLVLKKKKAAGVKLSGRYA